MRVLSKFPQELGKASPGATGPVQDHFVALGKSFIGTDATGPGSET